MTWHPLPLSTVTRAFLGRYPRIDMRSGQMMFPIPSLRGALAYWLRALAGPYVGDDITELLRAEAELFGAASDGSSGSSNPSRILLRGNRITVGAPEANGDLAYLMGPGLTARNEPKPRQLPPCGLSLEVRNDGSALHADLFLSALWALRTFGGIGARARRGFGTLAFNREAGLKLEKATFERAWLIRDSHDDLPQVLTCVAGALAELRIRQGTFTGQPRYPCFAEGWYRVEAHPMGISGQDTNALTALGKKLRTFRHPGEPRHNGKLPNTAGYREVARPYAKQAAPTGAFNAGALGLPVVYTVHGFRESVTVEPITTDGSPARRASPLWLRVTNGRSGWLLRSLAFYNEWLPEDMSLQVKMGRRGADREPAPVTKPNGDVVRAELDAWFTTAAAKPNESLATP
ncbi:RAMP superfamily CRISPR-associated protein [Nonomuraea sp. NPDC049419]|uniref:RAMP superfamily CRISPR-associated protein n=1 Tax=Nonomuraea sp. NPDC049419 TaxID=3155772 RepID=UPI00342AED47